jgi:hypothetical protein
MHNLNEYNLIWEEKGIILGIIYYVLRHFKKITQINIKDRQYRNVLRDLFPSLIITKNYDYSRPSYLNIYIKTNTTKNDSLILNNINNIDKIQTKKKNFFLLPWFNIDNPIIMFKVNEKKDKRDINKIIKKISSFNKNRISYYIIGQLPIISYTCNIIFWDIYMEYQILEQYCKYTLDDVDDVYKYLTKIFNSYKCAEKIQIYVPYVQNKYIYIQPNIQQHQPPLQNCQEKTPQVKDESNESNESNLKVFFGALNNKLSLLNTFIEKN